MAETTEVFSGKIDLQLENATAAISALESIAKTSKDIATPIKAAVTQLSALDSKLKSMASIKLDWNFKADIGKKLQGIRDQIKGQKPIEIQIEFKLDLETFRRFRQDARQLFDFDFGPRGGLTATKRQLDQLRDLFQTTFASLRTGEAQQVAEVVERLAAQFGVMSTQIIRALSGMNREAAEQWLRFARTGERSAEELYDQLVGHSIIPDLVNQINKHLARIPDSARDNIRKTIYEFQKLESEAIPDPSDLTTKGTPRVAVRGGRARQVGQELNQILEVVEKTANAEEKLGVLRNQIESLEPVVKRVNMGSLIRNIEALSGGLSLLATGKGSSALETIGIKLSGLKQIMFGLEQPTGLFGNLMDKITQATLSASGSQGRFAVAAEELARSMSNANSRMQTQLDIVRDMSRVDKASSREIQNLQYMFQGLSREWKNLGVAIASGKTGAALQGQIARLDISSDNLLQKIQDLRTLGIEKLGPAAFAELGKIEQVALQGAQAIQQETAHMRAMEGEVKGFAFSLLSVNGVVERVSTGLRSIFSFFKKDANEASTAAKKIPPDLDRIAREATQIPPALAKSVKQVKEFGAATRAVSVFRDVFFGTLFGSFGGDILSDMIFSVTNAIRQVPGALINLAANAAETQNRFEAVFGVMTSQAEQFVDALATNVGRDPFQIKETFSSLQSFGLGLGFAQDESLGMAKTVQALALDFASFNNITDDDAQQRFISGLSGSSEVFDRYGINIKEAALEQESYRLGINKSSADMTEQEKVIARLSIIYRSMSSQGAVGDAMKTADSFSNQSKRLGANLSQIGTIIGTELLPAVAPFLIMTNQILEAIGPNLTAAISGFMGQIAAFSSGIASTFTNALQGVIDLNSNLSTLMGGIVALFTGDFALAWQFLVVSVDDALFGLSDRLTGFITEAFNWGYNLVGELANGVYDAAATILNDAVNYVGDLIASFWQAQSPPETGPLATIDKWGSGLVETFGDSMENADMGFLSRITGSISGAFRDLTPDLGDATSRLEEARNRVAMIEARIAQEKAKGNVVPQSLYEELELAKKNLSEIQGQGKAKEGVKKQEAQQAKQVGKAASGAHREAVERTQKEKESVEDRYKRELQLIEDKRRAGLITEKEYAAERLKIEENYYDGVKKEGREASAENIKNIKQYQAEVQKIKDQEAAARQAGKRPGQSLAIEIPEFDIGTVGEKQSSKISTAISNSIRSGVRKGFDEAKASVVEGFNGLRDSIIQGIKDSFTITNLWIVNKVLDIVQLVTGRGLTAKLAKLAISGIFGEAAWEKLISPIVRVGAVLGGVLDRMGVFGTVAKRALGVFAIAAGPLNLIINAMLYWKTIMFVVNGSLEVLSEIWRMFSEDLGGTQGAIELITVAIEDVGHAADMVGDGIVRFFENIVQGDNIVATIVELFQSISDMFSGNEATASVKGKAYPLVEAAFDGIPVEGITKKLTDRFIPLMGKAWDAIMSVISDKITQGLNAAWSALPGIARESIVSMGGFFAAAASGAGLLGEVTGLIGDLIELLGALWPLIKFVAGVIGGVLGAAFLIVKNVIGGFVQVIPIFTTLLAGLTRIIRGVVNIVTALAQSISLMGDVFFAVFTGDFESVMVKAGSIWKNLAEGGFLLLTGLETTILAFFGTIQSFVLSAGAGILADILKFLGFEQLAETILTNRDKVINAVSLLVTGAAGILRGWADTFLGIVSGAIDGVVNLLFGGGGGGGGGSIFAAVGKALSGDFIGAIREMVGPFGNFMLDIYEWSVWLYDQLFGSSVFPDLADGIIATFDRLGLTSIGKFAEFVGGLIDIAQNRLGPIFEGLGNNFGPLVDAFNRASASITNNLLPSLADLGSAFTSTVVEEGEKVASTVGSVIDKFMELATNVIANIVNPAIETLKQKLTDIYNTSLVPLSNAFENIRVALSEAFASAMITVSNVMVSLGDAFDRVWAVMVKTGELLMSVLTPVFNQLYATLSGTLGPYLQQFFDWWNSGGASFEWVGTVINAILIPVLVALGAVIATVLAAVVGLVTGFASGLETMISGLTTFFNGASVMIDGLSLIFQGLGEIIAGVFELDLQRVLAGAGTLLEGFPVFFQGMWTAIEGIFEASIGTLLSFVGGFVEGAIGFFTDLYNELVGQSIVPVTINSIIEWFGGLIPWVIETLTTVLPQLTTWFVDMGMGLVQNLITGLSGGASGIATALLNLFSGAGDASAQEAQTGGPSGQANAALLNMQTATSNASSFITTSISSMATSTIELMTAMVVSVTESFIGLYTMLVGEEGLIPDLGLKVVSALTEASAGAVNQVDFMATTMGNVFKAKDWKGLGRFVVDGIRMGIDQNKDKVIEVIKQMANDAINAAKDSLGIASPSVVFAELGINTIEGFSFGLRKGIPGARDAMEDVVDEVEDHLENYQIADSKINWIKRMVKQAAPDIEELYRAGELSVQNLDKVFRMMGISASSADVQTEHWMQALSRIKETYGKIREEQIQIFVKQKFDLLDKIKEFTDNVSEKFTSRLTDIQKAAKLAQRDIEYLTARRLTPSGLIQMSEALAAGQSFGEDLDLAIRKAVNAQNDLNDAMAQQKTIQAEILKQQEARQKLDFLRQQMDLVNQIKESGLAGSEILAGLKLGINASVSDVVTAMTRVTEAMVKQLQTTLQIKSPSQVMAKLGSFIPQGLAQGIGEGQKFVTSSIGQLNRSLLTTVTGGPSPVAVSGIQPAGTIYYQPVFNNKISRDVDIGKLERKIIYTSKEALKGNRR